MKKIGNLIWGIWCAFTSFITPIWLTLTYFNLSGLIYKYDDSMDEGIAIIFGIVMVAVWVLLVLIPGVMFIKRIYKMSPKYAFIAVAAVAVLIVLSLAVCKWNIVEFLIAIRFI